MSILLAGFLAMASMTTAEPGEFADAKTANIVSPTPVAKPTVKRTKYHRGHHRYHGHRGHRSHRTHHVRHHSAPKH